MAIPTVSMGGTTADGTDRGLFLKVFSGEVMRAYERAIKISPLLTNRTITNGKSAQFPTTGLAVARYHTPGHSLLGEWESGSSGNQSADENDYLSDITQSERVIFIDNLLTASCFIDQLDEAMSHYDYRSAFSTELGRALARHQDNYALHTLVAAGSDTGTVDGETTPGSPPAEEEVTDFLSNAGNAVNGIYNCAEKLDEKNVPKEDRYILMSPKGYYNLLRAGVLSIDMHATNDTRPQLAASLGGVRGEPSGTRVAGMPVIVSNADGFCTTDAVADSGDAGAIGDTYGEGGAVAADDAEDAGMRNLAAEGEVPTGDDDQDIDVAEKNTVALVFHKSAAGIVKLKDITMESEYLIERQGTLMVAKLAQGMGALRNDGCCIIKTVSS